MGMPETILHRNASRQPKWDVSQGCRCRSTWDYPKGQQERPIGRAVKEGARLRRSSLDLVSAYRRGAFRLTMRTFFVSISFDKLIADEVESGGRQDSIMEMARSPRQVT